MIAEKEYRILITGACGVTSRSVLRALKKSSCFKNSKFIGSDICEDTFGLYEGLYHKIYKVPHSLSKNYIEIMERIILEEKIDAAIVIPELEVIKWAAYIFPTKYVVPPLNFSKCVINKASLYRILNNSGLVPKFEILSREEILNGYLGKFNYFPLWIRDYSEGSTSGKGALKVNNTEEVKAWVIINSNIKNFLLTEFLEGANYACHLLYYKNKIIKIGSYERLKYFMSRVAPSGITGNISAGKLINNDKIISVASDAVKIICNEYNEQMNGIIAVDLKADKVGNPYITEINLRHVAATFAFAYAGFNLAEYQLLLTLNKVDLIDTLLEKEYSNDNLILRDIDGLPVWIEHYNELMTGEFIERIKESNMI